SAKVAARILEEPLVCGIQEAPNPPVVPPGAGKPVGCRGANVQALPGSIHHVDATQEKRTADELNGWMVRSCALPCTRMTGHCARMTAKRASQWTLARKSTEDGVDPGIAANRVV